MLPPDPFEFLIPYLTSQLGVQAGDVKNSRVSVWLRLVGGHHRSVVIDSPVLDVLCFGEDHYQLARETRAALHALNFTCDSPVSSVEDEMLPAILPDPDIDTESISMFTIRLTMKWDNT